MRIGLDRSSDHGPKTVRTGLRTGLGPVFSRTDPSLTNYDRIFWAIVEWCLEIKIFM